MADMSMMAAVDKLCEEQAVTAVRLTTASRSCRAEDGVVIPIGPWNAVRRLAKSFGCTVGESRWTLGRQEAVQLGAALRTGAVEMMGWPKHDRTAAEQVLGVVAKGEGLIVSPVQGPAPQQTVRERTPPRQTKHVVILDSAKDPDAGLKVVCDSGFWSSVCGLAAENGHAVHQEKVISCLDTKNLAAALRRGAGTFGGNPSQMVLLWRTIDLCERGDGIVVTRRVTN